MANSELLLIEPVEGLGAEGDQVSVKAGFARNFLLPQKKAVPVTRSNRKQIDALKVRRLAREAKNREDAQAMAEKLNSIGFAIAVKTGESGKMFGAVTAPMVHEKILEQGLQIDKKKVSLPAPIKELGQHTTTIKLFEDIQATVTFDVVSENPIHEEVEEADDSE